MKYITFKYSDNIGTQHYSCTQLIPDTLFKLFHDLINLRDNELDEENVIHINITCLESSIEDIFNAYFLELQREYREFVISRTQEPELYGIDDIEDIQITKEVSPSVIYYHIHYVFITENSGNELPF